MVFIDLDCFDSQTLMKYKQIIPTQYFYRFFGDFDWSIAKLNPFLHFDKTRKNI